MSYLVRLQEQCRKKPDTYVDDFKAQLRFFESAFELVKIKPSEENKNFNDLCSFICGLTSVYKKHLEKLPDQIIDILERHQNALHPSIRRSLVVLLSDLRRADLSEPKKVPDKALRNLLYGYIVGDITRLNEKKNNSHVNRGIQNFMYSMLQDTNRIAAKMSLDVMIHLYRTGIWCDEKTVNVIATACFLKSKDSKMLVAALKFFLGVKEEVDDDARRQKTESKLKVVQESVRKLNNLHSKKTKKKESLLDKARKKLHKTQRELDDFERTQSLNALHMLHDPLGFTEKLFGKLKSDLERFEVRVMIMDVISRCISVHKLIFLNFYPLLQKYLHPSTQLITKILAITAQSIHELVPPEHVTPLVMAIANNFIHDRAQPEAISIGINTIREICKRQPLVMTKTLLQDLTQYTKSKNKYIIQAARGLITLFRELAPSMLLRRDRSLNKQDRLLSYGAQIAPDTIEGAELLIQYKDEYGSDVDISDLEDKDDDDGEWIDVEHSDEEVEEHPWKIEKGNDEEKKKENLDESVEKEEEDEEIEEEGELEEGDFEEDMGEAEEEMEEEEMEEDEKEEEKVEDEKVEEENEEEVDEEEEKEEDEIKEEEMKEEKKKDEKSKEESKKKDSSYELSTKERAKKLLTSTILSDNELLLLKKLAEEKGTLGKRKLSEVVDVEKIETEKKKRKKDEDEEPEEKEKWKRKKKKGGGKTNKEQRKNKPFKMVAHATKNKLKRRLGIKERQARKKKAAAKMKKWKLKHH